MRISQKQHQISCNWIFGNTAEPGLSQWYSLTLILGFSMSKDLKEETKLPKWIWSQIYCKHFDVTSFTIVLVLPVSLIQVIFFSFSPRTGEGKQHPTETDKRVLHIASYDVEIKMHNKTTDIIQQKRLSRKEGLCHMFFINAKLPLSGPPSVQIWRTAMNILCAVWGFSVMALQVSSCLHDSISSNQKKARLTPISSALCF